MLLLEFNPLLNSPCGLADTVDRASEVAQNTRRKIARDN